MVKLISFVYYSDVMQRRFILSPSVYIAVIQRQNKQYGLLLDKQLKSLKQCASDYCFPFGSHVSERRVYDELVYNKRIRRVCSTILLLLL